MAQSTPSAVLTDRDYARLLAVRTRLRVFESWSADRAAELGLTTAQHQLMLAVRGHYDRRGPTIGEAADYLLLKHHSTVELANRTQELGLIKRGQDATTIGSFVSRLPARAVRCCGPFGRPSRGTSAAGAGTDECVSRIGRISRHIPWAIANSVSHVIDVNFQHRNSRRIEPVYSLHSVSPLPEVERKVGGNGHAGLTLVTKRAR